MAVYCLFTLHATIASFGGVAVGETRSGEMRPARSALLGLIGAALGVERADADGQAALEAGYEFAVRTDAAGLAFTDYHTAQVPPARRGIAYATRRDELSSPSLETILTRRDYRSDAIFRVALWDEDAARWPLPRVREALIRPAFILYVGRKSCPLALPLAPELVEATDPIAALLAPRDSVPSPERHLRRIMREVDHGPIAIDRRHVPEGVRSRVERRRDVVASRARWQFAIREEAIVQTSGEDGA